MADSLWKECAEWLTAVSNSLLPPDHSIHGRNAQVLQLAQILRDGVLLCRLALELDPTSLDQREICKKPQLAQFYCLRNIRTFLHACRTFFDLKDADLFEPTMLFEYTDFGKVLHTLSKLSSCSKVLKKGITGFPSTSKNQFFEDEIYKSLEDMEHDETDPSNWHAPEALYSEYQYGNIVGSAAANLNREEVIYEDLCSFRKEQQVPAAVHVPMEKRDYSIRELVETEAKYVDALQIIVRHFMRPLSKCLSADEVQVIFYKIRELTEIHVAFHADLLKATNNQAANSTLSRRTNPNSTGTRLPQVLLEYRNKLLVYGPFCANLSHAQQKIDEVCEKSESSRKEIGKCQEEACDGKFKLKDLLQVPMQRVLKYHILLKEMLRNTSLTHEDYQGLSKAYEAMQDVAEYINEYKRDSENLAILKDIQESIGGWAHNRWPHQGHFGRPRQDGELKVKSHADSNKLKLRYVFLLDKMLILCKSTKVPRVRSRSSWAGPSTEFSSRMFQNEAYSFRVSLLLSDFEVEDPGSKRTVGLGGMTLSRESRWSHLWYLVHHNNKTAYTFYAKSVEKKRKWLDAFREAIDNLHPRNRTATGHVFEMYTFELEPPSLCEACHKLMKGSFYQGYRCGRCGVGSHKSCLGLVRHCACLANVRRPPELPPRPLTLAGQPPTTTAPSFATPSPSLNGHAHEIDSPTFHPAPVQDLVEPWLSNAASFVQSDYANLNLEDYSWYGGIMERDCATHMLQDAPDGTFMLRRREPRAETPAQESGYALSLKLDFQVRHMRVCQGISEESGHARCVFFLSQSRTFGTIMQLVQHYQCQSLQEAFNGLNACLALPWRLALNTATVLYAYEKQSPESGELSLKEGQILVLLSTEGESNGWWQGRIGKEVGYFPKSYVKPDTFHGY